jgi:uncharacterized membrane protein YhaH (DUF805 family)
MNIVWLLFLFKGRISRGPFWIFNLACIVLIFGPVFLVYDGVESATNYVDVMSIVLLWPSLAVQAKRWHDRDKSAWWLLINFVPIIGFLWALIEAGFLPGTASENRFGAAPNVG